ncbi:MAG: GNAT family N-acetyltransferase [Mangrovicoccus sp.]|nr:GNAT family N-acetyltransferase [Mangrovicoccus sp.]
MHEPVLTTQRLRLRRPISQDLDGFMAFAQSERAQYLSFHSDPAQAWRSFCVILAHWDLRGYGMFALTLPGADRCLGLVGPWYPQGWPEQELGWMIWTSEAEGQGYAQEAALAARGYAYKVLGWDTAVSYIAPENTRSIALAERLGAILDPEAARPNALPCSVYRHATVEGAAQ